MAAANGRGGAGDREPQDLTDRRPRDIHRPIPRPPAQTGPPGMAPTGVPLRQRASSIDQLSTAAACGDLGQVQLLISHGVSVNQRNMYGRTPIQVMRLSRPDIAEALLEAGADSNACDRSRRKGSKDTLVTPLHDACRQGFLSTVRCLVRHGADVEAQDAWGNTPAHVAGKHAHAHIVRYLAQGQDVARSENSYTLTPLDYLRQRHPESPPLSVWIADMSGSPPSLKRLTCICIRRSLGPSRLAQYRTLPICSDLQDKVMLQDTPILGNSMSELNAAGD